MIRLKLQNIFQENFNIVEIGSEDSLLFDLSLTSIQIIQLISIIEHEFNLDLEEHISDIFTISDLEELIENHTKMISSKNV